MDTHTNKCTICGKTIWFKAENCMYCGARFAMNFTSESVSWNSNHEVEMSGRNKFNGTKVGGLWVESNIEEEINYPSPTTSKQISRRSLSTGKVNNWIFVGIGVIGLLALTACLTSPVQPGTPQPLAITNTITSIPTEIFVPTNTAPSISTPISTSTRTATLVPSLTMDPKTGVVTGTIQWGDQPYNGVKVKLCKDWLFNCKTTEYSAITDQKGSFFITGIEPGDYQFITKVPDQSDETRLSFGGLPTLIKVVAGEAIHLDPILICRVDLKLNPPKISGGSVYLSWEAYPEATDYNVKIFLLKTAEGRGESHTTQTHFSATLGPADYSWEVNTYLSNNGCATNHSIFTVF